MVSELNLHLPFPVPPLGHQGPVEGFLHLLELEPNLQRLKNPESECQPLPEWKNGNPLNPPDLVQRLVVEVERLVPQVEVFVGAKFLHCPPELVDKVPRLVAVPQGEVSEEGELLPCDRV